VDHELDPQKASRLPPVAVDGRRLFTPFQRPVGHEGTKRVPCQPLKRACGQRRSIRAIGASLQSSVIFVCYELTEDALDLLCPAYAANRVKSEPIRDMGAAVIFLGLGLQGNKMSEAWRGRKVRQEGTKGKYEVRYTNTKHRKKNTQVSTQPRHSRRDKQTGHETPTSTGVSCGLACYQQSKLPSKGPVEPVLEQEKRWGRNHTHADTAMMCTSRHARIHEWTNAMGCFCLCFVCSIFAYLRRCCAPY
jgi:hypothetical protein